MPITGNSISTKILTAFALLLFCIASVVELKAQITTDSLAKTLIVDTVSFVPDTLVRNSNDSLVTDSLQLTTSEELKSKVHYTADDSIKFDIEGERVYLYGNAKVNYEDIQMDAAYIEVDWTTRKLFARGVVDSTGNESGLPIFKQGADMFTAKTVIYNFDTKKGKITQVNTKQGDGFILGQTIKKIDERNYFIRNGAYTTCDLPHPHYSISAKKLKVVQNNKVVTGPAYLVIEDVPMPLAIPFGFFPTRKSRSAGILLPAYGESGRLGFYFKDGGYYFGIGDVVDFAITTDIYTLGSWAVKLNSNYANRYRYNGNVSVSYSEIKTSEKELPDYNLSKDFFIRWNHRQDSKARPSSVFSANVNAGSSSYYQNNLSSASNYLTNTFQSSVAWSKSWPGKPYAFTSSLSHSQNTITKDVSLSLPNTNFSVNRLYPFKRRVAVGTEKWFEKIGISYQNNFQNSIQTKDSLLFKEGSADQFRYGMSHSIPVSTSFKILKHFTLSPSISYNEKWYTKTIRKNYDAANDSIITDTISAFRASRDFLFSASMNTRVYGMLQFRKGKIAALRHVMSPTISYGYRPDYSDPSYKYYKEYQTDAEGNVAQYSIFETGIFGGAPSGKYGVIGFNLDNNLEMKTRSVTDTSVNFKKIKIFESLAAGVSYNTAVDSFNWSNININGRTILFDRVNINLSASFDPYALDESGSRINTSELEKNNRLARLVSSSFAVSFALNNNTKKKTPGTGPSKKTSPEEDLVIPYNLSINYNLSYSVPEYLIRK
ncbi:MAG: LPS-assembly protein LptD [Bacteroidetes bacterium]|nr:LPS-assembly protein LptD [Bacteroidota bacterium]